jgi:hypothetical protein
MGQLDPNPSHCRAMIYQGLSAPRRHRRMDVLTSKRCDFATARWVQMRLAPLQAKEPTRKTNQPLTQPANFDNLEKFAQNATRYGAARYDQSAAVQKVN